MGNRNSIEGGYRVFSIHEGSPVDAAGLEIFFDYVVALNDQPVGEDKQGKSRCFDYFVP